MDIDDEVPDDNLFFITESHCNMPTLSNFGTLKQCSEG